MNRLIPLLLSFLLVAGCRTAQPVEPVVSVPAAAPVPTHENLNAVLWTQTSVEYAATTRGIYSMAQRLLDEALADTSWTADPVQRETRGFGALPRAIIMDLDETVLDNSAYQARLVERNETFSDSTWSAWVQEIAAGIVPGAAEFIRSAQRRGVRVFFVTNRDAPLEEATVDNLETLDIPAYHPSADLVLTRGERPEWVTSDKEPRRAHVRADYRILLYVGDNLGDFISGERGSVAARAALVRPYASYWGRYWIMLPNPQYGSWEGALFDNDFSLPADSQRAAKYRQLKTLR